MKQIKLLQTIRMVCLLCLWLGMCVSPTTARAASLPEDVYSEHFCQPTDYLFGCRVLNSTGVYLDTLKDISGSDSVVLRLNLTVSAPTSVNIADTVPVGTRYLFGCRVFCQSTAGIVTPADTLQSATECDSIVNLKLVFRSLEPIITTLYDTTEVGKEYLFGCKVYVFNQPCDTVLKDSLPGSLGRDSIVTLNLNVKKLQPIISNITDTVPVGTRYLFACKVLTQSTAGTLTSSDTLKSVTECDSIVNLALVFRSLEPIITTLYDTTEVGKEYLFGCKVYVFNQPCDTVLKDSLPGSLERDSIVTLNLNVKKLQPIISNITDTVPVGTRYLFACKVLTQSTTGTITEDDTLQSVTVRDSIVSLTLHFEKLDTIRTYITDTICGGEYLFGCSIIDTTGVYYDTLTTAVRDSIVILTLTVGASDSVYIKDSARLGDKYYFGGDTIHCTKVGTFNYVDSLVNTLGCDSIIYLELNVFKKDTTFTKVTTDTICASVLKKQEWVYVWKYQGTPVDTIHINPDTLINLETEIKVSDTTYSVTHDTTYIYWLDLIVAKNFTSIQKVVECGKYIWHPFSQQDTVLFDKPEFEGEHYAAREWNPEYAKKYHNDSIYAYLTLTLYPEYRFDTTITSCNSYYWDRKGINYTQTGVYYDSLITIDGCDSLYILNLTIHKDTIVEIQSEQACGSYQLGDTTYTIGVYTNVERRIQSAFGCDSVVRILNLVVGKEYNDTTPVSGCGSYTWTDPIKGDTTISQSGTYTREYQSAEQCDSIVTMNVTIYPIPQISRDTTVCDAFVWEDTVITTNGSYTRVYKGQSACGCDSSMTYTVTVHHSDSSTIEVQKAYNSYEWHGKTYTQSGEYRDTLHTMYECDSICILKLTIVKLSRVDHIVLDTVCKGTMYKGRLSEKNITEQTKWQDSVRWEVDTIAIDSIYHYTVDAYRLPYDENWLLLCSATCGESIWIHQADSAITADWNKEPLLAPNAKWQWQQRVSGQWNDLSTDTLTGLDKQVEIRLVLSSDCDSVKSDPRTITVQVPKFAVTLVPKYHNHLLMINKRELDSITGWTLDSTQVKWYRSQDDKKRINSDGSSNDTYVGTGFSLPSANEQALSDGFYYVVILYIPILETDCKGYAESESYQVKSSANSPQLAPTLVKPNEPVRLLNLDPTKQTQINIYTVEGQLINQYHSTGVAEYALKAAVTPGYYLVAVKVDDMKVVLNYIVK